jgi:hypothetical protein
VVINYSHLLLKVRAKMLEAEGLKKNKERRRI